MTAGWMLLSIVAGMVAVHFLIHRPDRANRAIEHAAEVDGLVDEIGRLSDEVFRAEEGREWAELSAETARCRADFADTRAETAEAALRGLLLHQARAELVEPDAASGKVLRFERAGR